MEKAAANAKKTKSAQNVPDVVTVRKADLERMVKVRAQDFYSLMGGQTAVLPCDVMTECEDGRWQMCSTQSLTHDPKKTTPSRPHKHACAGLPCDECHRQY